MSNNEGTYILQLYKLLINLAVNVLRSKQIALYS